MSSDESIAYKLRVLQELKIVLTQLSVDKDFLLNVESNNPWFIPEFTKLSIASIISEFLDESKLENWLRQYGEVKEKGSLGLILAGNIPLVGFHDILCAYFCSSKVSVKISSKDSYLTKYILDEWSRIDTNWSARLHIVERIENCEKIIATGSNNSHRYFEQYFKKYKHILRRNRTSVAVIHRDITNEELNGLMKDIFLYFGLGCRNVSKLWIEEGFELSRIFEHSEAYSYFFQHPKYMNNYDYQRTLLLLNKVPHLSNNFLMLKEDTSLFSPISTLFYEWYKDVEVVKKKIQDNSEDIQCVIGYLWTPFGKSQLPALSDYADGIDVMEFLLD